MQDNKKGKYKAHMQSDKGQYRTEIYKGAESMIPQIDGTYNVSDSSDTDSYNYLDLASTNIIQYRTRGQKQRQKANERADPNRCPAHIEYIKPNTKPKRKGKRYQMMKILIWTKGSKTISPDMLENETLKIHYMIENGPQKVKGN